MSFKISSQFKPTGDQPQAIDKLVAGINAGEKNQVLLGVTGSGKTFTMANVIERVQKPTLIISHNKTLAGQLAQEFKSIFPASFAIYNICFQKYWFMFSVPFYLFSYNNLFYLYIFHGI